MQLAIRSRPGAQLLVAPLLTPGRGAEVRRESEKASKRHERLTRRESLIGANDDLAGFFRKLTLRVLRRAFGNRTAAVLVAVLAVLTATWIGWQTYAELPGVKQALNWLGTFRPMPRAHADRFTIVIMEIENDSAGVHRRAIRESLLSSFPAGEVDVLLISRAITIDGEDRPLLAVEAGHARARELLLETGASVALWGTALEGKAEAPMTLHWTVDSRVRLAKTSGRYKLDGNFDLPPLFRSDLVSVLSLIAASQAASFGGMNRYDPDRHWLHIARVRRLVLNDGITGVPATALRAILADGLLVYGQRTGKDSALREAIGLFQEVLTQRSVGEQNLDWRHIRGRLGLALSTLGDTEAGTVRLEEAVVEFRRALGETGSEDSRLQTAALNINLGVALERIGTRQPGTRHLKDAAAAFRNAQIGFVREAWPLDWALAQHNLGNALSRLGAREAINDNLIAGANAYRAALGVYTRDATPRDWAGTQYNLGTTLAVLGMRDSGTSHLEDAVAAFRAALEVYTRESDRVQWLSAQLNLGRTLLEVGEREVGTSRLEEALEIYTRVLPEQFRDGRPFERADTQARIGLALSLLGKRTHQADRLLAAISSYEQALQETDRRSDPMSWAALKIWVGTALEDLATIEGTAKRREEAVAAYKEAQAVLARLGPQYRQRMKMMIRRAENKLDASKVTEGR